MPVGEEEEVGASAAVVEALILKYSGVFRVRRGPDCARCEDMKFQNGSCIAPCIRVAITLLCDCRHDPGSFIALPTARVIKPTHSLGTCMPAQFTRLGLIDTTFNY